MVGRLVLNGFVELVRTTVTLIVDLLMLLLLILIGRALEVEGNGVRSCIGGLLKLTCPFISVLLLLLLSRIELAVRSCTEDT